MTRDLAGGLVFAGAAAALVLLFAAGLRVPLGDVGWRRWAGRVAIVAVAAGVTLLANVALFRHDVHFDVTASHAFTPSADAERVVQALTTDVELTYFYQKQDPGGRAAKTMVEILGRTNPRLHVRTVDPDQHPGLASRYGVRVYNVAVLESGGRRLQVTSTEDRDIALGLLRVTRTVVKTICFAAGHGEYDIENMEYHTHFEGAQGHSHDAHGMGVVITEQHGLGRLRRALDALGFAVRKVTPATAGGVSPDCAVLLEAGPRTRYAPPETEALAAYLSAGGAALLLLEPGFAVDDRLAALLARAGVRVDDGVVVDPLDHYFTDEQMIAVSRYATHPITRGLTLSFYPGARPVEPVAAAGVRSSALFASSAQSFTRPAGPGAASPPGVRTLAVAAEGALGARPFRLVVVGDVDFASNSFFPYMSNSDLVMGMLAWLLREERAPTVRPAVEVLPTVTLTNAQVRGIFLATAVALPGSVALAGGVVWWRRRR
jgi:hypothetical protein